mmetsp:Transcript_64260/g.129177  ORF Transcript_64260/g.129177 Transcript_64260/m.129177 type:complete len:83 (-) Transcript_64260:390-638(-)
MMMPLVVLLRQVGGGRLVTTTLLLLLLLLIRNLPLLFVASTVAVTQLIIRLGVEWFFMMKPYLFLMRHLLLLLAPLWRLLLY